MLQRATSLDIPDFDWSSLLPRQQWEAYRRVLKEAEASGLPVAVAGGLAFSLYSHRWRDTKDMDLMILPSDREAFIGVLERAGFVDYYDRDPYRRDWIYRGYHQGVIVDLIWQMANDRADVDPVWLERGPTCELCDVPIRFIPVEELVWAKLYVLHRDRSDWADLLNILHIQGGRLDWEHLLERVGEDANLLAGLMCVFHWLAPERARCVPRWVWERLNLTHLAPEPADVDTPGRAHLIDSYHDWFGPTHSGRPASTQTDNPREGTC